MKSLKGKPVFDRIDKWTKRHREILLKAGIMPKLGVIRVGRREDDLSYEKSLIRKCEKLGIALEVFEFEKDVLESDFLKGVTAVNMDPLVHGILMFRPLPEQIDYEKVLSRFKQEKDIDGMLPENLGHVLTGNSVGFAPCTSEAVFEILKYYDLPLEGANVAVVNNSNVVGKPLAMMLTNAFATATVCHHKTKELKDVMKSSDVIISAVGKAKMFGKSHITDNQYVIDVGINMDDQGKLCGDIDFDEVRDVSAGITPVPGGVGGVTTSILLRNVVRASFRALELRSNTTSHSTICKTEDSTRKMEAS